jgi:alpha-L-rhamnosidase
VNLRTE